MDLSCTNKIFLKVVCAMILFKFIFFPPFFHSFPSSIISSPHHFLLITTLSFPSCHPPTQTYRLPLRQSPSTSHQSLASHGYHVAGGGDGRGGGGAGEPRVPEGVVQDHLRPLHEQEVHGGQDSHHYRSYSRYVLQAMYAWLTNTSNWLTEMDSYFSIKFFLLESLKWYTDDVYLYRITACH